MAAAWLQVTVHFAVWAREGHLPSNTNTL